MLRLGHFNLRRQRVVRTNEGLGPGRARLDDAFERLWVPVISVSANNTPKATLAGHVRYEARGHFDLWPLGLSGGIERRGNRERVQYRRDSQEERGLCEVAAGADPSTFQRRGVRSIVDRTQRESLQCAPSAEAERELGWVGDIGVQLSVLQEALRDEGFGVWIPSLVARERPKVR